MLWTLAGWPSRWRVSYVRITGEIYAVHHEGPLFVLGVVPADRENRFGRPRRLFYDTLEAILTGWAQECIRPNSLPWVRDRLRDTQPPNHARVGTERPQ